MAITEALKRMFIRRLGASAAEVDLILNEVAVDGENALTAVPDGTAAAPSISFINDTALGFRRNDGRLEITDALFPMLRMGRKQFTNLQGDFITANTEWTHPAFDVDTENAAVYMKLDHRGEGQDDFIYGIYFEIDGQNITGGSATKTMHFGQGDAHFVALFHDTIVHGSSGGIAFEAASFTNGTTGFLASWQGGGGFGNSNPIQKDSVGLAILIADAGVDPTSYGMDGHNLACAIVQHHMGNAWVSQFNEFIPNTGVPSFKTMDHNQRLTWASFCSGETHQYAIEADVSNQNRSAPETRARSYYWDSTDEQVYDVVFSPSISGAPSSSMAVVVSGDCGRCSAGLRAYDHNHPDADQFQRRSVGSCQRYYDDEQY